MYMAVWYGQQLVCMLFYLSLAFSLLLTCVSFSLTLWVWFLKTCTQTSGPAHGPFLSQSWLLTQVFSPNLGSALQLLRGAVSCLGDEGTSWTLRCFNTDSSSTRPSWADPEPHKGWGSPPRGQSMRQEVLGGPREAEPTTWSPWTCRGLVASIPCLHELSLYLLDWICKPKGEFCECIQ